MSTTSIICVVIVVIVVSRYWIFKNRITPWSGGILFMAGDDKFLPIKWRNIADQYIGADTIIRGIFLPGARRHALPGISIYAAIPRDFNQTKKARCVFYWYLEEDNGTFIYFDKPLDGKEIDSFCIDVSADHPWKGWKACEEKDGCYHNWLRINFRSKPNYE